MSLFVKEYQELCRLRDAKEITMADFLRYSADLKGEETR